MLRAIRSPASTSRRGRSDSRLTSPSQNPRSSNVCAIGCLKSSIGSHAKTTPNAHATRRPGGENQRVARAKAATGSVIFLILAPGVVAGLLPWWLTRWQVREGPADHRPAAGLRHRHPLTHRGARSLTRDAAREEMLS